MVKIQLRLRRLLIPIVVSALSLLIGTVSAKAQLSNACLTIKGASQLAIANEPSVQINKALRLQARADVIDARSLYRPQLSGFARTGAGNVGLIDSSIQNQVGLNISQRLIDFGDAKLARRASRFDVEASTHEIDIAQLGATESATRLILTVLEAQEAIAFTAERSRYFERQLSAIDAILDDGGATLTERAQVAAQLANANSFYSDLQLQLNQAKTRLSILAATSAMLCDAESLESELSQMSWNYGTIENTLFRALRKSPDLLAMLARENSLAAQSERERRARLPIISVIGSLAYSSTGTSTNFDLQERVGIDVSVPLYTGNALTARSRRANARQAVARSEVGERRRAIEEDVRTTYQRVISLNAKRSLAAEYQDQSHQLFKFAVIEYDAGTRTLGDLIDARLEFEQAGLEAIELKFEILREQLHLAMLLGGFDTSVN